MSAELKPGDRFLDRFHVERLAAEGGMASVYAAKDEVTGHDIAIKCLYPYYLDNDVIRSRFLEEGRIQQFLRHPNILRVFQVIEEPLLAILMEYVEGPTLDDFLAESGPLDEMEIIDIIIPVMSAVGFAHSRNIVHRDIKPSNILLHHGDPHNPKVLDFGVAKVKSGGQNLTATGTTVGTLHYMSPEQIVGSKNIDGRADVYSLGVTMYKLIAGEVPFNAPTEFALMMAQVEAPPLPPSKLRPGISPEFEAIILRAMEKKPSRRFQTIKEFTSALLSLRLGDKSVEATLTGSISSEIINLAMAADQIARDRDANEEDFASLQTDDELELASDTAALERTIKITRSPGTEELSNSSIIRLRDKSRIMDALPENAELETDIIPSLKERTAASPQPEQSDETRPSIPSKVLPESPDERPTRKTRPSRPSVPAPGPLLPPDAEPETVSMGIKIRSVDLIGGVHVADDSVDSRDMTAPRVKERDLQAALEAANSPKMVIGLDPMDTSEHTRETPARTPTPPSRDVPRASSGRQPIERFPLTPPQDDWVPQSPSRPTTEPPQLDLGNFMDEDPTAQRSKEKSGPPPAAESRDLQVRVGLREHRTMPSGEHGPPGGAQSKWIKITFGILILLALVVWALVAVAML